MFKYFHNANLEGVYMGVIEDPCHLGYGAIILGSRSLNNISLTLNIVKVRATVPSTYQETSTDTASHAIRPGNSPSKTAEYNRHFALFYRLLHLEKYSPKNK